VVRTSQAMVTLYATGDLARATAIGDQAVRDARRGSSPRIRTRALAVQAELAAPSRELAPGLHRTARRAARDGPRHRYRSRSVRRGPAAGLRGPLPAVHRRPGKGRAGTRRLSWITDGFTRRHTARHRAHCKPRPASCSAHLKLRPSSCTSASTCRLAPVEESRPSASAKPGSPSVPGGRSVLSRSWTTICTRR
jgi:hypothetical protein